MTADQRTLVALNGAVEDRLPGCRMQRLASILGNR